MADYVEFDYPSWINNRTSWDKVVLDGETLPGICYLQETGIKLEREKNKGSGKDSGSVILRGMEAPDFTIEVHIHTSAEESNWFRIQRKLLSRIDPRNRTFYSVYHPLLAEFSINTCIIHGVFTKPPLRGGPLIGKINCTAVSISKSGATKNVTPKGINAPNTIDVGPAIRAADPRDNQFNPAKNPQYK